jgi:hypothetical protein
VSVSYQGKAGPLAHAARSLAAPGATLTLSKARTFAARALFALVTEALDLLRELFLRRTRYTNLDQESTPLGPCLGVLAHRRGFIVDAYIFSYYLLTVK